MEKDILGYEGLYTIDEDGNVYGYKNGAKFSLNPLIDKKRYATVILEKNGHRKWIKVHQLVAQSFLGPRPSNDFEIDHKDDDRLNNSAENLQYVTRSENRKLSYYRDHRKVNRTCKLSDAQVASIRRKRENRVTVKALVEEYDVSPSQIRRICNGLRWNESFDPSHLPIVNDGRKLTEMDVVAIRNDRNRGMKIKELGEKYGVAKSNISQICNGKRWNGVI